MYLFSFLRKQSLKWRSFDVFFAVSENKKKTQTSNTFQESDTSHLDQKYIFSCAATLDVNKSLINNE